MNSSKSRSTFPNPIRLFLDTAKELGRNRQLMLGMALVAAAGVSLHLLATAVDGILELMLHGESVPTVLWVRTLVVLLITSISTILAWGFRHSFRELTVPLCIEAKHEPRPRLILFVSSQKLLLSSAQVPLEGSLTLSDGKKTVILARANLLADAAILDQNVFWSWEMCLRGIEPHLPRLKEIYLVGSADGKIPGTHSQLEILRRFLAPYLVAAGKVGDIAAAAAMIKSWDQAVDFEDFLQVDEALQGIRNLCGESAGADGEICVDITGGQKPTTAAAGAFTLNKDVVLQYVQTSAPKVAKLYDVRLHSVPESVH